MKAMQAPRYHLAAPSAGSEFLGSRFADWVVFSGLGAGGGTLYRLTLYG